MATVNDISKSVRRVDAVSKCEGKAKYLPDIDFRDCLWARMIRSSVPRGKIIKVNLPDLPSGYCFVDYRDIPEGGHNYLHMIATDWKCFAEDEVRYVGETIGLLVGPDRTVLADLIDRVSVDYEEQIPAVTIDEGLACKGGAFVNGNNIHCHLKIETGENADEVFKRCAKIVEETVETGFQEHIYLETNGACCCPEGDGYVIYASAQCPFYIRKSIAPLLNISPEKITVRQTVTGGAFGGKEHFPDVLCGPLLVAAHKTGKCVKMVFDREEDIENSVKRHPSKVVFKTGLDKEGNILVMDSKVYYNVGGYLSSSFVVLQRGCFHVAGCYSFPSFRSEGFGVATNTFPSCAFRGFGAPQTLFAVETHMCHLAQMQGLDPLEFKSRYFIKQGDTTSTNGKVVEKVMIPQMLEQVLKASDYRRKVKEYKIGSGRGIGISFYNHGGAFTGNGEQSLIKAHCRLHKYPDGHVEILCGQTEMGQGFHTILPKIAAHVLEIPIEKVVFEDPDTSRVPDSGPTAASRSTMIVGDLVEKAAKLMKDRYSKESEFEIETEYEHPEGYPWNQDTFQGYAYLGYGWGVCAVEVEVDPCTAEVAVKGVWSSHDGGHPVDELIVHGQVNGGVLQGIGWASTEVMENTDGHFRQTSMSDYIVPTSMDCPRQGVDLVDNPYEWGPFGAKGLGELVFNGSGAAYIDALSRAIGKKINAIPVPTEKVMEYILHGKKLGEAD
ncbi:MAG: xanthine dehydrogenase family protein molybdopterin-binding subunit [Sphaerochaetaceae bacterium]|nr:xanthine dehydrogenase family protein molybdopterin-binding subunit [Sphaerochaetaceae bacterium]